MNDKYPSSANGDGAQLFDLVSLIQSSVNDIVSEYSAIGASVPPLDSSSPKPGPFDAPEEATAKLMRAVRTVEAACAQLCASVASPALSLTNKAFAFEECSALQVICGANIADFLRDAPDGLHVSELEKKTGIDADKLARVLRLLATKHVFREVQPNVFANNRLSVKLLSDDSCSDFISHKAFECFEVGVRLHETVSDRSPGAPNTSFERVYGEPMFDYLKKPANQHKASRFAKAMKGWADITGRDTLTSVYPWHSLPTTRQFSICDVGGGNGHVTMALLKTFPDHQFKVIVQDMQSMLDQGKVLWQKEYPIALQNGSASFVPIDFFRDSPVAGCDFYYLRHCLHNWSDENCVRLLSNIASAMRASPDKKGTTRLLIHDMIIHYALSSRSDAPPGLELAPAPLLSNFGVGRVRAYNMDINMLNLLGDAKERTVEEFVALGSQAGLDLVRVWDAGSTFDSIVEFKLI